MYFIRITTIILLLGGFWALRAQESVNCFGADGSGSGGSVAISVGQVAYTYQSGATGQVNQGVQQAAVCTTCTQLQSSSCNSTNIALTANVTATAVSGALGYRFRIVGSNTGATGWSANTFILNRTTNNFKFNMAPGVIWGQTYQVQVAVSMDGVNYQPYGNACNVTLQNIPTTQLETVHCGSTNVALSTFVRANSISGAAGYRFRVTGTNTGGTGWIGNVFVLNRPNREFRFDMIPGVVSGITYQVEVAVLSQNGVTYGSYGTPCSVTLAMGVIASTSIAPSICALGSVGGGHNISATPVTGALGYRFRIVGSNTAGWVGNEFVLNTSTNSFQFNNIPGLIWGQSYAIQAAILSSNGVTYGPYGTTCSLVFSFPTTSLLSTSCGVTGVGLLTAVRAGSVTNATGYRFRITGSNSGTPNWVGGSSLLFSSTRTMKFADVPGVLAGQTYQVEVAVRAQDGITFGPFGAVCSVTLSNVLMQGLNPDGEINTALFEVAASHNPFITDFALQVLTEQLDAFVQVTIYDMSGKQIETKQVAPLDMEGVRFGANLASGMYLIEVKQGSNQAVLRQVKN